MGNANGTVPSGPRGLFSFSRSRSNSMSESPKLNPSLTPHQLVEYTGEKGKPIYISLRSDIYDVSEATELYGPNGSQAHLAGRDISRAAAKDALDNEDELLNLDLSDLSSSENEQLDKLVESFKTEHNYPKVGRLLLPVDSLTHEELHKFDGVDNPRGAVYVAVQNVVYDVTANGFNHYGPDGTYSVFAGHDATRALACMSLDPDCLDCPCLEDLTAEQVSALQDWGTRFQQKYAVVGTLRY